MDQVWTSHHPYIVPQPFTLKPTESYSKADLDEYIAALEQISKEAYENPEIVHNAPYNSTIHKLDKQDFLDNPKEWCITWRSYQKKSMLPELI